MTQEEALPLIYKAADILSRTKHLPIKIDRVEQKATGVFHIFLTDTKILAHVYGELGEFDCTIFKETYEDMNTNGIDLLAKIPSEADEALRITLRLGFMIFTRFTNNFVEVFKKQDEAKSVIVNYTNAKIWYDRLGKK